MRFILAATVPKNKVLRHYPAADLKRSTGADGSTNHEPSKKELGGKEKEKCILLRVYCILLRVYSILLRVYCILLRASCIL